VSGRLVGPRPAEAHHCGVNAYGVWSEARPLPTDHLLYDPAKPGQCYYAFVHMCDAPGTVRACDECGRTWVAFRQRRDYIQVTRWRPERRFERRCRERRARVTET